MNKRNGVKLLYASVGIIRQLNRIMDFENLTQGEYLLLRYISSAQRFGGELAVRAASLSEALDMSRPAISRILNGLEEKDYIMRKIDKSDRRGVSIELTEKGSFQLKKADQIMLEKADEISSDLGEDEVEKSIYLLEKLIKIYKNIGERKQTNEN